jgi:ribosome-associated toxin RatA of RatAB toxin-antitoxin module
VTTINKSALVRHSAMDMFKLVDDIDAYPEFLPWCSGAKVLKRTDDEVQASIEISKGAVHKSFTTLNRSQQGKIIEMRLVEGPFHHLQGFWRFDSLQENACKVSFDLEFEFSSKMVGMVVGPVFNPIANTLVDAFCKRADEVYGSA